MKFRTFKRHLREGVKSLFRNGWMSIASIGAVTMTLFLVAAFLAIILNLNQIAKKIESDVEIKVLIDLTADETQIKELGDNIRKINGVDTVTFVSNDEELQSFMESFGEEGQFWELFEQDNPLNHTYVVRAIEPQDTEQIATTIERLDYVSGVVYGKDVVQPLFKFNEYARTIGLIVIIGLVLSAIFLISNTIKLTIMARKTEIGIMKLVGATNGFIRWPFFVEGMLLGILGSLIPITLILVGYHYIDTNIRQKIPFDFIDLLPFNPFAWELSLIILLIGTVIGVWGSVMSVRKFLKV